MSENLPDKKAPDFKQRTALAKRHHGGDTKNLSAQIESLVAGLIPGDPPEEGGETEAVTRLAFDQILAFLRISQDFIKPLAEKFTDDPSWEFLSNKYKLHAKELEKTYDDLITDPVRFEAVLRLAFPWERNAEYLELLFTEAVAEGLRKRDFKTIELYAKISKRIADGKGPSININNQIANFEERKQSLRDKLRVVQQKD